MKIAPAGVAILMLATVTLEQLHIQDPGKAHFHVETVELAPSDYTATVMLSLSGQAPQSGYVQFSQAAVWSKFST